MVLSIETRVARQTGQLLVRLLDGEQELSQRTIGNDDESWTAWRRASEAMERHNQAVALEQAARTPGVLPLPLDHVPAAEHFMIAVYALFPDLAVGPAQPDPPQH